MVILSRGVGIFSSDVILFGRGVAIFSHGVVMFGRGVAIFCRGVVMFGRGVAIFRCGVVMFGRGVAIFCRGVVMFCHGMAILLWLWRGHVRYKDSETFPIPGFQLENDLHVSQLWQPTLEHFSFKLQIKCYFTKTLLGHPSPRSTSA